MVKIAEAIKQANENGRYFVSFEFTVPTTEAGVITLYDRIERLAALDPLFCGITWDEGGRSAETSIEVASTCQSLLSVNHQVNLTGYASEPEEMLKWLTVLKSKGVCNVLITRGASANKTISTTRASSCTTNKSKPAAHGTADDADAMAVGSAPSSPPASPAFPHAVDLVRFVRQHFGNFFGIAVVAFPEGEGDSADNVARQAEIEERELRFLKEKMDAGADYIITHSVFDVNVFDHFCQQCRRHGIRCPILPGVLPISQLRQLNAFGLRRLAGTADLVTKMEAVKGSESETRRVVVAFYQDLVKQLLNRGCGGVYLFTMNADYLLVAILKGIEVATHRMFPWRPSENEERRRQETVRPVHWSSRVTSYMVRTAQWQDRKTDKWNPVSGSHHGSALALGEVGGYHARLLLRSRAKRCTQFLVIQGMPEIQTALSALSRIFVAFLDGNGTLPWADELSGETVYVGEHLLKPLNARGLYTINSQPHVNGAPSSHKVVGWGPGDGCVYQKSYLEFFCPLTMAQTVFTTLERYPSLQYMAMDAQGNMVHARWRMDDDSGKDSEASPPQAAEHDPTVASPTQQPHDRMSLFGVGVTAVTWGVFPGREVIQPTIVSVDSFRAWVGEAFDLWAAPFPGHDVPAVVRYIQSEWVLVSVVDNTYQETPTPLENAVVEICSKIPPLIPVDLSQPRQRATSLTFPAKTGVESSTLGTFATST
ncbi:putative methylenetetrahydrofolate reductase [Leptomonas pyrrhocoris]|uniref:Putative methylenetetrahydrofolate reductase n=1 Tax=Leptomonas pyrrhocoris TaxID=157538 RepID=A0A0M9G171_LEPPY|nr:putative methylenetetrahydrofolate reductase [Leptomonas pyrrhocoris]KPA80143.1 putative methylenetetrahydrofolate reductase [Leptomonas pyrrhocoris]|eukprot:XP_015658582.1 putative methylenetetrahydrofolate reductase [Leptomonas pyrrhocoris]